MELPKSYFEDEVRDGFFVPAMMKRAWAAQLQILEDVDRVCRENNIQYFAEWGTLLGAVRHHGFIPWDDDMDICMKRADYNKFLAIAEKELPQGYSLFGIHQDSDMDNMLTRVINTRTIEFDDAFLQKFHGFPFCSGIDIFPLDFIAPDPDDDAFMNEVIHIVNSVAKLVSVVETISPEIEEQLCRIEELCAVSLKRDATLFQQLNVLMDNLCSLYTEDEAEYVTIMMLWVEGRQYKFPKKYYAKSVRIPFEGMTIPVPIAYDSILKKKYRDYMKPVHTWDSHDYPYYQRQINVLKEKTGAELTKFRVSYEEVTEMENRKAGIRQARKEKPAHRKEIVFLPYKASTWNALHSVWEAAVQDSEADVYVIPTPFYYKNLDGSTQIQFDVSGFPENVHLTSVEQYNIEERCPDVIVIQNPYDEYNLTTTVHPMFYAKNLIQYTDELVYIPYFKTEEIDARDGRALRSMESYCRMPGVVYADKVFVQSENMAEHYVNQLCQMAGEESRTIWQNKITGMGSPLEDKAESDRGLNIPEDWGRYYFRQDGKARKAILMYTSANSILEYGQRMIHKLRNVLDTFKKQQNDIVLLWYLEQDIESTIQEINPKQGDEFFEMLSNVDNEYLIMVKDNQIKDAVNMCDGYYGDSGVVAQKCRNAGKPVLLLSVDCD